MAKVFLFVVVVLAAAAVGGGAAEGSDLRITSAEEFMNFARSASSYSGTTVYLDSDIALTGSIEPINNFKGTFDGQGHTLSSLVVNSSSCYVGFFGYLQGMTIRNVVIDSASSITSSFVGLTSYVGGIIGHCSNSNGHCIIENNINMASVTFNGNVTGSLYLGGIVGELASFSKNSIIVRNCANYGPIVHSGISGDSRIGGIIGGNANYDFRYFQNCMNYGTITHNGTTSNRLYMGGIVGNIQYASMENCLSAGRIYYSNNPSYTCIGTITGAVGSNTSITYSFFTNDVGNYNWIGSGSFSSTTGTPASSSTVPDALSVLNTQVVSSSQNPWNRWLSNPNSATVAFRVNNNKEVSLASQAILLPDPADSNEHTFSGWFTDEMLSTPFDSSEVGTGTTLYGTFCMPGYVVALEVNGGDESTLPVKEITVECNGTYGTLPEPTKEGHRFLGWFSERTGGEMITPGGRVSNPSNHSLYAHWDINQYTVTFVSDGRTIKSEALDYGSNIAYPANPSKTGHSFSGWDKDIQTVPAENITITAQWTPNKYTVTLDVNGGDESSLPVKEVTVTFNSTYGALPVPNRSGFIFLGWFSEENVSVTSDTAVTTARNHSLRAHWSEIVTAQVEIVFGTKDLSDEKIREIVKEYTDAEFKIFRIEDSDTDGLKVIIKFDDAGKAEEFVRSVRDSSDLEDNEFIRIGFSLKDVDTSFSTTLFPMWLLVIYLLA